MEVADPTAPKPPLYADRKPARTEVIGSDAHHPSGPKSPGSRFTWIKMGAPTIDGLRLALLDGRLSVRRSDEGTGDPNDHAALAIEAIEVVKARYLGRAERFAARLNPWLNAVIGGRGTGKSTLVEFLRIALRREKELPTELAADFAKYARVYQSRDDDGLLTDDTQLIVTYRKDGARFRIQWSPRGDLDPILEERADGTWNPAEGEIRRRFPVRIYSQKQIFQLAKAPLALLGIVDDAPEVGRRAWQDRWDSEETRFLSLRAKARELEAGLSEEPRLRGDLDDVKRRLGVFETAGHADILKAFQTRRRQQRAVDDWEKTWADAGDRLRTLASELVPGALDSSAFDQDSPPDAALHERAEGVRHWLEELRQGLQALAANAEQTTTGWRSDRDASAWAQQVNDAVRAYGDLKARLAASGAGDPAAYGELVQSRQTIEQRLGELGNRKQQVQNLQGEANESLARLLGIRRELTESRRRFMDRVLAHSQYARIRVVAYGARQPVEAEFRRLLQREGGEFEKDIGATDGEGLLGRIYADGTGPEVIEKALAAVKRSIRSIAGGQQGAVRDQRFGAHVRRLAPEALDRLDLWFPEDSLDVEYSVRPNGREFRPIQEGSPGQKTAALLAFLLSYGDEPLILDQPEDDLDNRLIYDLVVTQLREVKRRRQVVVVTHNANIVVNGDAELVMALVPRNGETQMECADSLQDRKVRETVCAVMEGGREAFEQRYRRIALETRHV